MPHKENLLTSEIMREALLLRLREAARQGGVTELSRKTGIRRAHIYRIIDESGSGNPTLEVLTKLAAGLGMKVRLEGFRAPDKGKEENEGTIK